MSEILCAMNQTKGVLVANRVRVARSLWDRARGLLGTGSLPADEGLWLTPCRSVHTFFMRYTIDVAFLDGSGRVVSLQTLPPWRMSNGFPKAEGVLELAAGTLKRTRTEIGDKIVFSFLT